MKHGAEQADGAGVEVVEAEAGDTPSTLLDLLEMPAPSAPVLGLVSGRVAEVGAEVRVRFPGCGDPAGAPARCMVPLHPKDVGAEVILMFELGDVRRPVVLGPLVTPGAPREAAISRDGERLVLRAEQEISLECGEASITLTRSGKVLIRGTYVLSAASGTQRILGGSVEIN